MIKKEKQSQELYPIDYNLLIVQDLWQQPCYLNLVNNIAKEVHTMKCKYGHDDKKCKSYKIKYKDCDCFCE